MHGINSEGHARAAGRPRRTDIGCMVAARKKHNDEIPRHPVVAKQERRRENANPKLTTRCIEERSEESDGITRLMNNPEVFGRADKLEEATALWRVRVKFRKCNAGSKRSQNRLIGTTLFAPRYQKKKQPVLM